MPDLEFASDEQWANVLDAVELLSGLVGKLKPRERALTIQEAADSHQPSPEEELAERDLRRHLDDVAGLVGQVEEKVRRGRVLTFYCRAQQRSAAARKAAATRRARGAEGQEGSTA